MSSKQQQRPQIRNNSHHSQQHQQLRQQTGNRHQSSTNQPAAAPPRWLSEANSTTASSRPEHYRPAAAAAQQQEEENAPRELPAPQLYRNSGQREFRRRPARLLSETNAASNTTSRQQQHQPVVAQQQEENAAPKVTPARLPKSFKRQSNRPAAQRLLPEANSTNTTSQQHQHRQEENAAPRVAPARLPKSFKRQSNRPAAQPLLPEANSTTTTTSRLELGIFEKSRKTNISHSRQQQQHHQPVVAQQQHQQHQEKEENILTTSSQETSTNTLVGVILNNSNSSGSSQPQLLPSDAETTTSAAAAMMENWRMENSAPQQQFVEFLVYNFKSRRFVYKVPVQSRNLPNNAPGIWMRIFLFKYISHTKLEFYAISGNSSPLAIRKAFVCQRHVPTRSINGQTSFMVLATLRRNARLNNSHQEEGAEDDVRMYHCRLGSLFLRTGQLKDPDEGIGDGNDDDAIPERIRIWCFPCFGNSAADGLLFTQSEKNYFRLQMARIDERYYIAEDDGDENNSGDEGDSNLVANDEAEKGRNEQQSLATTNGLHLAAFREKSPVQQLSTKFSGWLSTLIQHNYEQNCLSTQRRALADQFRVELQVWLRQQLPELPGLRLELFGSVNSGFGSDNCDLDICMMVDGNDDQGENREHSQHCDALQRRKILLHLTERLRYNPDFEQVTAVLDARTPIVKFEHRPTGFHGDISVENRLALYNTELLQLYTQFDARVAPLGFAIKRWAKLNGVNDAAAGSISSYAYTVMLIHLLQRCEPPVLPFLQEYKTDGAALPPAIEKVVDTWEVRYTRDLSACRHGAQFCNQHDLGQLFYNFLHYYGSVFSPERDVVQIRSSSKQQCEECGTSITDKRSSQTAIEVEGSTTTTTTQKQKEGGGSSTENVVGQETTKTERRECGGGVRRRNLVVQDPFNLEHNLTSGVRADTLKHIRKCLRSSQRGLERFEREHFFGKEEDSKEQKQQQQEPPPPVQNGGNWVERESDNVEKQNNSSSTSVLQQMDFVMLMGKFKRRRIVSLSKKNKKVPQKNGEEEEKASIPAAEMPKSEEEAKTNISTEVPTKNSEEEEANGSSIGKNRKKHDNMVTIIRKKNNNNKKVVVAAGAKDLSW